MDPFTDLTAYEVTGRSHPAAELHRRDAVRAATAGRRQRRRHRLAGRLRSVADRLEA